MGPCMVIVQRKQIGDTVLRTPRNGDRLEELGKESCWNQHTFGLRSKVLCLANPSDGLQVPRGTRFGWRSTYLADGGRYCLGERRGLEDRRHLLTATHEFSLLLMKKKHKFMQCLPTIVKNKVIITLFLAVCALHFDLHDLRPSASLKSRR